MFFLISSKSDNRFPNNYQLDDQNWLNTDDGWYRINTNDGFVYYKGYILDDEFNEAWANSVSNNYTPKNRGSFLAVIKRKNDIIVTNDRDRATPIWIDRDSNIGNIGLDKDRRIWAEKTIKIHKTGFVMEDPCNVDYSIGDTIDLDAATDVIYNRLVDTFHWFKRHQIIPKIFFTGGSDTLLCLSMLRHLGIEHEMVWNEYLEYDKFFSTFRAELQSRREYWAYAQLHYWREPTYLVTGGNGDENFLRGPATADMILTHYGIDIVNDIDPSDYMYSYFHLDKNLAVFSQQRANKEFIQITQNRQPLLKKLLNTNINDHQHWHIGNTITFTPYKDIDIFKTILRLNARDIKQAIFNAQIQKNIINKAAPELLTFLNVNKSPETINIWRLREYLGQ